VCSVTLHFPGSRASRRANSYPSKPSNTIEDGLDVNQQRGEGFHIPLTFFLLMFLENIVDSLLCLHISHSFSPPCNHKVNFPFCGLQRESPLLCRRPFSVFARSLSLSTRQTHRFNTSKRRSSRYPSLSDATSSGEALISDGKSFLSFFRAETPVFLCS